MNINSYTSIDLIASYLPYFLFFAFKPMTSKCGTPLLGSANSAEKNNHFKKTLNCSSKIIRDSLIMYDKRLAFTVQVDAHVMLLL